jgi:hypothetical protein
MSQTAHDSDTNHEDNRIEFKMQMTLFVHDMPEIPKPETIGCMDTAAFMQATEIYNKLVHTREWLMQAIDKL